jgi:aerobic C4-dicarboxylate transport protein
MSTKRPLYKSLYAQVLFAVAAGVLLGHFYPSVGADMKPLGDGFIKLIKMIIAPIIFCTVVVGIAGMEDMKKVGKTGGLALLYFEIVSTLALIVGLVIVNVLQPGAGMNVDASTLDTKGIAAYTAPGKMQTTVEFLLNVIPTSVVDAFAKGEILQVLLFSVLFGFALHKFGGRGTLVFDFIEKLSHGRVWRDGFHHWQVRRGFSVLVGQAHGCVLPHLLGVHLCGAGHHCTSTRFQRVEVCEVHQRRIAHRVGHIVV